MFHRPGTIGALGALAMLSMTTSACRNIAPNDDSFARSGSRLKVQFLDGGDGAQVAIGFFDSQEGTTCAWAYDEAGDPRCLPRSRGEIRFLDAACTQPVLLDPGCGGVPSQVTGRLAFGCDGGLERIAVYDVGGVISPSALYEYDIYVDECQERIVEPLATHYSLQSLSPDKFVAGAESQIDLGYGLRGVVINGDDGSRWISSLYDIARDATCAPEPFDGTDAAAELRCVPGQRASANGVYFADSACSQELANAAPSYGQSECAVDPGIILRYEYSTCGNITHFHDLGEEWTGPLYSTNAGTCSADPANPEFRQFEIGDEVGAADFPPFIREDVGAGRLRASLLATPNENVVAVSPNPYQWVDGQLDDACMPLTTATGETRCGPTYTYPDESIVFADAACSVPALWFDGGCDFQPPASVSVISTSCGEVVFDRVYRVGTVVPGTIGYAIDGGTGECTEVDFGGGFLYEVGPELALESLPLMTYVIDPS